MQQETRCQCETEEGKDRQQDKPDLIFNMDICIAVTHSYRPSLCSYTGRSKSRAHHTKQLYFAGLMHKLQDIYHLLLMFITLHLRNAKSNYVFTTYARNGFPVEQCMRELFLPCLRPLCGAPVN
jgi:hypothetical protein